MTEIVQPSRQQGEWTNGKFSCCDSCKDIVCMCFCPNCYACATAQLVQPESACGIMAFFCPVVLVCVRGNGREQKGIDGSCCGDFVSFLLCPCCTTMQLNREFFPDMTTTTQVDGSGM